jgi:ABC-type glycerol-3-phosphate transport system permease component
MGNLKLTNTYHGLALAFTVFSIPMTTYQLAAYFKGIPNELIDAAKIDGATGLQTIFRIILPIARPALITIGLINFVWTWNDLLLPLIMMQDMDMFPLILSLALLKGRYGAPPPLIAAGVVIGIAPVAIAYLLAQEHIVKGMTLGAIKS